MRLTRATSYAIRACPVTAPVGRVVGIFIDTRTDHIDEGDVIRTQTGRSYRVVESRRQTRGKHVGRWHLRVLVVEPESVTADDRVIEIWWYSR